MFPYSFCHSMKISCVLYVRTLSAITNLSFSFCTVSKFKWTRFLSLKLQFKFLNKLNKKMKFIYMYMLYCINAFQIFTSYVTNHQFRLLKSNIYIGTPTSMKFLASIFFNTKNKQFTRESSQKMILFYWERFVSSIFSVPNY